MPWDDQIIFMAGGGFFMVLGIVMVLLGRREQKGYYNSLTDRSDAREYLEHWPERPRLGAVKIGGWVSMAVGLALLVTGVIFWLRG